MKADAIPEAWIKSYVDQLLELAGRLPDGWMRDSCLMRADYAMDLVKLWREQQVSGTKGETGQ